MTFLFSCSLLHWCYIFHSHEYIPPNHTILIPPPLKFTVPFLSNPIFSSSGEIEEGAVAPGRGKREAKSLYFHSRTLVPANPSISELPGEEEEKIIGRRKKKWGMSHCKIIPTTSWHLFTCCQNIRIREEWEEYN